MRRRNTADIAGLNVSELIAEKTNEKTIVMANWLYSRPVRPGMNATGTNTAASTSVIVTIGAVISAIAARTAGIGRSPRSRIFLDVLDHDDRVVDDQPDGQDQPAKRERVDREAEGGHHREGRHQGDRDRQHGNDRRPHALKEDEDDQQHEQERFEQGLFDLADVLAHILGRVVGDPVLEPGGKALGEPVHALAHLADDVERVGVGVLVDRQRAGRLAAQPAGGVVVLRVELDAGDVAQAGRSSRRRGGGR